MKEPVLSITLMTRPRHPLVRARFAIFLVVLGLVAALVWMSDRIDPVRPATAANTSVSDRDREPANPAENR
jgi:hypothetical protein